MAQIEHPGKVIEPGRGQAELRVGNTEIVRDRLPRVQHAVTEPGALDRARFLYGAHQGCQRIRVVEEPGVGAEVLHVPGDCHQLRDVAQSAEDAARPDAVADRLPDTMRFRKAQIALPGAHAADGDRHGDEVRPRQNLAPIRGELDAQPDAPLPGHALGVAGHRLGHVRLDVDQGDCRVREERRSGQVGDETGREDGAPGADDDDFHLGPS